MINFSMLKIFRNENFSVLVMISHVFLFTKHTSKIIHIFLNTQHLPEYEPPVPPDSRRDTAIDFCHSFVKVYRKKHALKTDGSMAFRPALPE